MGTSYLSLGKIVGLVFPWAFSFSHIYITNCLIIFFRVGCIIIWEESDNDIVVEINWGVNESLSQLKSFENFQIGDVWGSKIFENV